MAGAAAPAASGDPLAGARAPGSGPDAERAQHGSSQHGSSRHDAARRVGTGAIGPRAHPPGDCDGSDGRKPPAVPSSGSDAALTPRYTELTLS